MRKFGNYITASPVAPSTNYAAGRYEISETHSLTTDSKMQALPYVSNYNIVSANGYGTTNYGGYGRTDGVYVNTIFTFSISLQNIPPSLVNNAYIICVMTKLSGKSNPSISASNQSLNGNYDFSGNDYDVLSVVGPLTNATTFTSPQLRSLWSTGSTKSHNISFYLRNTNSTDTNGALPLGTFYMYRIGGFFTTSFSTSSIEEGASAIHYITAGTNGRASTSATLVNTVNTGGAATASDISGLFDTSYSVASNETTTSRTVTAISDGITEGTETVIYDLKAYYSAAASYMYISTFSQLSITDPPPPPSFITSGTKAPILGSGAASTYPAAGWTDLQNASVDDAFVTVPLGFTFYMAGTAYTTAYLGSNSYLTFGNGSTNYSSLSASNPAFPKFMFGAADNSYQRVSYKQSAGNWCKIRYEGNGSTSGTVGSPGITVELTLYNPAFLGTTYYVCEILIGNHNRLSAMWGAFSASTAYTTGSYSASSSHVFVSTDTTGSGWKQWASYYVTTSTS